MSLKDKPYYFLTDRTTFMHYLVDNRQTKQNRYLYYPKKYETMTSNQIQRDQIKLSGKFLIWSMFNKQKMNERDWRVCVSKAIDVGFGVIGALLLLKFTRRTLFRVEFTNLEELMEGVNLDVRFWKTIIAYSLSSVIGYNYLKSSLKEIHLFDLALEYQPNFCNNFQMPEIQPVLSQLYNARFPPSAQQ